VYAYLPSRKPTCSTLSLTVSFKRIQTKTKQLLHYFFTTYARNTLCLPKDFPFPSILQYCSKLPSSIAPKLQIRSDRTARHSTMSFDFQQTDLNDFPGVGISTRCFCLNYHQLSSSVSQFLLPSSHRHRQQQRYYDYNNFLWHDFASAMSGMSLLVHINSDL